MKSLTITVIPHCVPTNTIKNQGKNSMLVLVMRSSSPSVGMQCAPIELSNYFDPYTYNCLSCSIKLVVQRETCVMSNDIQLKSALVRKNDEATNNNVPQESSFLQVKRTTASKKLLSRYAQPSQTTLVTLSGAPLPSRKREELTALANLRKKISPSLLRINRKPRNYDDTDENKIVEELDNRPKLLQKVLLTRPVTMVVQWSEVCTAWQDSDFITECLCWHNVYRQRHGAPQLVMDPKLCDYAQAWANHLAHSNKFSYRNDRNVGQNLYQRPVSALQPDITGQEASSYWYAAVKQYKFFNEPDVLHANVNAGHFTQMVWMSTHSFGVGKARTRAGKVIVVANYFPPGNTSGHFDTNVLPPLPDNMIELSNLEL